MPVCSRMIRALSRSRLPAGSKTLAPFLYHTATIQQCKPAARLIAHRAGLSRPKNDDDVPFEDAESLPPSIHTAEPSRKTTITGSERAAFEKLYKTFTTEAPPEDDVPFAPEMDQIVDEWYEEDEEKDADASLDTLFDAVLSGMPPPGQQSKDRKSRKPAENLATLAESILRPELEHARRKPKRDAAAEAARIRNIRDEERERVTNLLSQAQTDREIWEVLEREVLDMIRKLDLDGIKKPIGPKSKGSKTAEAGHQPQSTETISESPRFPTSPTDTAYKPPMKSDPRILFPNYPIHLNIAAHLLRTKFPTSTLPLAILPTIKSLGRSSYALGATAGLYNLLIRTAWLQHASYDYMDELLRDMDNGGIEFNAETLDLLDSVLNEFRDARRGKLGPSIQSIWLMEQFEEGAKRLEGWRDVVSQRLGASTQKRAGEGKSVRLPDGRRREGKFGYAPRARSDDADFRYAKQVQGAKDPKHLMVDLGPWKERQESRDTLEGEDGAKLNPAVHHSEEPMVETKDG